MRAEPEFGLAFSLLASSTKTFPLVAALEDSSSAARCRSSVWQDSCVSAKARAAGRVDEVARFDDDFGVAVGGSAHSVRESSSRKPSSPSPPRGLSASIILLRDPGGAPGASVARRKRAARRGSAVGARAATARGRGRRDGGRGLKRSAKAETSTSRSRVPLGASAAARRGREPSASTRRRCGAIKAERRAPQLPERERN